MYLSLHLAWLEGAFAHTGCPICTLRPRHERDWLEIFTYDHSGDPGITRMLSESRGFCHRHAWALAVDEELRGPLALALTYEHLARRLLAPPRRAARVLRQRPARAARHDLWALVPGQACPACQAVASVDGIYARVFGRSLDDDGFVALYERSEGLCLAHLNQVLAASPVSAQAGLLRVHAAKLEAAARVPAPDACGESLAAEQARLGLSLLVGADPRLPKTDDQPPGAAIGMCNICATEREAEVQGVAAVADDPGALATGAWLCARHAWQVYRLMRTNALHEGFAAWLRGRLEAVHAQCVIRGVRLPSADTGRSKGKRVAHEDSSLLGAQTCTVCSAIEAVVRAKIAATPSALRVGGVCLRHLAMYRPDTEAASEQHGQAMAAMLQELAVDLGEFIRKSSWQCRHEPKGREQDSWRWAISLFVGDA